MRPRIGVVIHQPLLDRLFSPEDKARLNSMTDVAWADKDEPLTLEEAKAILTRCRIGVGSWNTPWPDGAVLAACPSLELWVHAAGTVKHMFGAHLKGRKLTIASCAPAIADGVAEITLGQLIVGLKRILPNAASNRSGPSPRPEDVQTLAFSSIGVIGASEVGKGVIRHLVGHRARVLLYDPFVAEARAREWGVEKVGNLVDLCRRSDAVTLHAPLLPETRHLLKAEHFKAMKDNAVFVNTSRGGCLDEPALVEELRKNRLFAFLDVTDPEPAHADSPLRFLPNVVLTSHVAGSQDWSLGRQSVDDVDRFLKGEKPLFVVSEEQLERLA